MPFRFKKTTINKLQFGAICLGLIAAALIFLMTFPQAVKLAESQILSSQNYQPEKLPALQPQVAGAENPPPLKMIDKQQPLPTLTAQAVLVQDLVTGQILYQKNIHQRFHPASVTKLMTALVAVEHFKPADVLIVPKEALVSGSTMGLAVGENLTFRSLLYGMLLNSGNDAAYTIAFNYPGGLAVFVDKMNERVAQMKLADTHFDNPAGFDGGDHYSSAYDLAQIAQTAVSNSQLAKIVATKETQILSWDKSRSHSLKNLNKLLAVNGVIGIKTGSSQNAGENFIGLVEKDEHKILTVVLASSDRFGETTSLIDWVFTNFEWR